MLHCWMSSHQGEVTLKQYDKLKIEAAEYHRLQAQGYFQTLKYIPPRMIVNVQNEDNHYFELDQPICA